MTKGSPRLSRLGVLAPVALSACMDASVLAVPVAGAMVSTVLKELSKAFMLKKWFHGIMTAEEAEDLIMKRGKNGSFLVRESQTHPGEYVLSVRVRGKVNHVMIKKQHNKYGVGSGEYFEDLVELIEHFRSYPIIKTSGDILRLLQPVSGTKHKEPDIIHKLSNIEISENMEFHKLAKAHQEFNKLKHSAPNTSCTSMEGSLPQNSVRNRYQNILPYDRNRVILKPLDNTDSSDYINASHIYYRFLPGNEYAKHSVNGDAALKKLCDTKSYIAAQGCMPNTIYDFWLMIWQQEIRIVAAIGLANENGQTKYETYWPEQLGVEQHFENFVVTMLSQNNNEHYIVREFKICDGYGRKRTVFQYQITAWRDHGVPDEPCGVLMLVHAINNKLLEFANSDDPPKTNIVCVHCSAGVGRTGTFIALDILLNEAKLFGNANLSVIDTVSVIRAQRRGMVQTSAQYKFIYKALNHYFSSNHH